MTTIYLVTTGDYSDYHVLGAYSTKTKAERAQDLYQAYDIEEYELDDMPDAPPGLVYWRVEMDRDGNTQHIMRQSAPGEPPVMDWRPGFGKIGAQPYVAFSVWAKDEAHAIKIANERRTRLIADGEWTTDHTVFLRLWNAAKAVAP